jgi:molybdopterin/thiamine biosynthesis adenylyltransferase
MLLLGSEGQVKLRSAKVGIIGLGGAGSQIAYLLAAIGVGKFVLIDPDVVETTNIPRLHGASKWHSMSWLTDSKRPQWLRSIGKKLSSSKVHLASKVIRERNSTAKITAIQGDFCSSAADQFKDCDYIFLAADTHSARLQFNALVHQYLIAGVQVGAKAVRHNDTGELTRVYSVVRPVTPDNGCLWCNELIKSGKLQDEAVGAEERKAIKYGLDNDEPTASIASLNATATSQAVNDFMIWFTGLSAIKTHSNWYMFDALIRKAYQVEPRKDDNCPFCGSDSKKGSGNKYPLPYE